MYSVAKTYRIVVWDMYLIISGVSDTPLLYPEGLVRSYGMDGGISAGCGCILVF